MKKCRRHKWEVAYIGFNHGKNKFIGAYCKKCNYGHKELLETAKVLNTNFATYEPEYFDAINEHTIDVYLN